MTATILLQESDEADEAAERVSCSAVRGVAAEHAAPMVPPVSQPSQLQRQFRLFTTCNRILMHGGGEHEMLTDICRALVDVGGYRLAWMSYAGAGTVAEAATSAAWCDGAFDPSAAGWVHSRGASTPAARAIQARTPQIVRDIAEEHWSTAWRTQALAAGYAAALAMPLLVEGDCVGVVEIYAGESTEFEVSELAVLADLAANLAYGVAALRSRHECRRQQVDIVRLTRVLRMQQAINAAVLRNRDRDLLLQEACRVAVEVGRYGSAVVWSVEPGTRYARPGFRAGRRMPNVAPDRLRIGDGIEGDASLTGRSMRTGEVNVCCDLTRSDLPLIGREALYADGVRSVVALPFMLDGNAAGALTLTSADASLVGDDELLLLRNMAEALSFAVRSQQHAEAPEYLAHYDSLTGFAKRSLFCRRLDNLPRDPLDGVPTPTVIVFDVDELNELNDSFGRYFGDLLLQKLAERLRDHARNDDRIGDLGGALSR